MPSLIQRSVIQYIEKRAFLYLFVFIANYFYFRWSMADIFSVFSLFLKYTDARMLVFKLERAKRQLDGLFYQQNKLWGGNNPNLRRFTREKTWFDPFFLRSTENWTLKSHGDKRWKQFTNSFLEMKFSRVHARKNPTKLIYHHLTVNPYRQITDTHKNGA